MIDKVLNYYKKLNFLEFIEPISLKVYFKLLYKLAPQSSKIQKSFKSMEWQLQTF